MLSQTNEMKHFSYLGLGLMAARKSVLTATDGDVFNVTSPCVHEAAKGTPYKYTQNMYYVT